MKEVRCNLYHTVRIAVNVQQLIDSMEVLEQIDSIWSATVSRDFMNACGEKAREKFGPSSKDTEAERSRLRPPADNCIEVDETAAQIAVNFYTRLVLPQVMHLFDYVVDEGETFSADNRLARKIILELLYRFFTQTMLNGNGSILKNVNKDQMKRILSMLNHDGIIFAAEKPCKKLFRSLASNFMQATYMKCLPDIEERQQFARLLLTKYGTTFDEYEQYYSSNAFMLEQHQPTSIGLQAINKQQYRALIKDLDTWIQMHADKHSSQSKTKTTRKADMLQKYDENISPPLLYITSNSANDLNQTETDLQEHALKIISECQHRELCRKILLQPTLMFTRTMLFAISKDRAHHRIALDVLHKTCMVLTGDFLQNNEKPVETFVKFLPSTPSHQSSVETFAQVNPFGSLWDRVARETTTAADNDKRLLATVANFPLEMLTVLQLLERLIPLRDPKRCLHIMNVFNKYCYNDNHRLHSVFDTEQILTKIKTNKMYHFYDETRLTDAISCYRLSTSFNQMQLFPFCCICLLCSTKIDLLEAK
ncbi:unnamed protein product [Didymodactylos carnosus]|uniref:Uncharacterized protein n=1 Tax=Didymodactylos carnosus TaxID=1234261 RepID=A0A814PIA7_9BILA|nr:unnamed protein product [Didymodactylos carnosus]CAF3871541.1 unnamed protein product [Didymodactylos carnosus]